MFASYGGAQRAEGEGMETTGFTPVAGRTVITKKDAFTGSVFLSIVISALLLVFVQAFNVLFFRRVPEAFWPVTACLVAADAAACAAVFARAFSTARGGGPQYAVAYRSDGYFVVCHGGGSREYIAADRVLGVRASRARLRFLFGGWAYSQNAGCGKIVFYVRSGRRAARRSVRGVADCVHAARFISEAYLVRGEDARRRSR